MGFRVYNRNLYWPTDAEFLEVWSGFAEAQPYTKDRRYVLWSIARSLRHLDGDTAECGVFNGSSSYLMCAALGASHHAFDSFEGLSEPDTADLPTDPTARHWRYGDLAVGEQRVQDNLAAFDVTTYRGWIPERFDEVAHRQFKMVHVDVDLEQPTRDSIDFFFPRLVAGGVILCDDYGSTLCPGAKSAMDELSAAHGLSVIHLTTGQGLIIKS